MQTIDITGKKFGTLTVQARTDNRHRKAYYLCTCTCGASVIVRGSYLRDGTTAGCGDHKAHPYTRRTDGTYAGYYVAHAALRERMGSASTYLCAGDDNECPNDAHDWAYLGCDEEVAGPGGIGTRCPRVCPSEYAPLCRAHHIELDRREKVAA
ncbi:hypothetical protein [Cellulosimicrobium arenosum]|uniref:Uncharacterized protein n=1 Tax=Cellulosimicrobium arenosum TaxID=2708133 RepID=A0A927G689_9MICO|nr:hypothetical protein [Cellulosimicrobium arenosum]MBD8077687.1 hypothetical protein [Cellulosimicrobium arenosum]